VLFCVVHVVEFKATAAAFLSNSSVIALLEETGCICGVTVLGNELFILRYHQAKIKVYDSENYSFKRDLLVPNLLDPCDLVSCSFNNCLYISEPSYKYIHRVDLSSNGNSASILRWSINEVWTKKF